MAKVLKIHPENPHNRAIEQVVDALKKGAVIIYPTDTVYGLGCDIFNAEAMEKLARLKGLKLEQSQFSIVCNDLSHLSTFTRPIDNTTFRLLKRALPGPFTFLMNANNSLPSYYKKRETVGIRVPDHKVSHAIVEALGSPIASTSLVADEEDKEYYSDPELIRRKYDNLVDIIIDSGTGGLEASSVVDLSQGDGNYEIIREGKGKIEDFI
ncbi:Putative translation factor (SUA5) [Candidatus Ornithobacterium hominis]|uniref:Translation factor (SUA5) n=1 Tax=Candidatus Ornithobacterium hominis TaxID=2497989 RepID=A0A383TZX0_9FLAO|nr:L-threonylcarbamoyladenylate synthase [Candidatus Ornithobacterium hominis]MCT7904020.1 L-threonylcarbamoyladenylate synthase [Candidatus Ornithobacterium hominis]CAI9430000.1 L-threonylcarbamoyladenylate synthase [Candidatus Ornithobacterium hominis]SZD72441.1 Putative translation factor (SUA5) [Candidatus Ornithobacterium hominis]